MARKTKVSILYNQPVTGSTPAPQVITEDGRLADGSPIARNDAEVMKQNIDLSEVGVVEEMDDIKEALNSVGYKTTVFNVDSDVFRLIDYIRNDPPEVIFNLVECLDNQAIHEMHVAGLYELMKIPYTGANPLALGLALNKPRVKELLSYNNIPTPRHRVFGPADKVRADGLTFPLFVKPAREDASIGIDDHSVVYTPNELRKRVHFIIEQFEQPALVEEFIDGRELNVAILGSRNPAVLPISEIDFSGLTPGMHKIVSYEAKWIHGTVAYDGTRGVCPARLPQRLANDIGTIALRCFQLIGCRDYARVDFRLSADGTPYVLEVNPNPDISEDAGFARSARTYGLAYPEAIGKIVESAIERTHG